MDAEHSVEKEFDNLGKRIVKLAFKAEYIFDILQLNPSLARRIIEESSISFLEAITSKSKGDAFHPISGFSSLRDEGYFEDAVVSYATKYKPLYEGEPYIDVHMRTMGLVATGEAEKAFRICLANLPIF